MNWFMLVHTMQRMFSVHPSIVHVTEWINRLSSLLSISDWFVQNQKLYLIGSGAAFGLCVK